MRYRDIDPINPGTLNVTDQAAIALNSEGRAARPSIKESPIVVAIRSIDITRAIPSVTLDAKGSPYLVEDGHGRDETRAIVYTIQIVGGLKRSNRRGWDARTKKDSSNQ